MRDPYLYEDSDVLINKFNIHNKEELDKIERNVTAIKLMQIENVGGDFDFKHLKEMHRFIFGDIYDWAGKEREIPIEKREEVLGGISVQYAYPSEIKSYAEKAIANLHKTDWNGLTLEDKSQKFAIYIAALWQAHTFREGNTRTTIAYACEFAKKHGFPMEKQLFSEHSGYTRKALVMASIGKYSEYEYLSRIFKDSMERGAKKLEKSQPLFSIAKIKSDKYTPTSSKDKRDKTKNKDLDL